MRILLVGASGTLGRAIDARLSARHTVLRAHRDSTDYPVDITRPDSIRALFERTGEVDAIVVASGSVHFAPLAEQTDATFDIGIRSKMMGQINVALIGQHFLKEGGSITLTSGILSERPTRAGSNVSAINAAVEGFVRGAAVELGRERRINVVSPTVLEESLPLYGSAFPGDSGIPADRAAQAYVMSVEGVQTGQCFRVWQ